MLKTLLSISRLFNPRFVAFLILSIVTYILTVYAAISVGVGVNKKIHSKYIAPNFHEIEVNMRYKENKLVGFIIFEPDVVLEVCRAALEKEEVEWKCGGSIFSWINRECVDVFFCRKMRDNPSIEGPGLIGEVFDMQVKVDHFTGALSKNVSFVIEYFSWEEYKNYKALQSPILFKKPLQKEFGVLNEETSWSLKSFLNKYSNTNTLVSKNILFDTKFASPPDVIKLTLENLPFRFIIYSTFLNFYKKDVWVLQYLYRYWYAVSVLVIGFFVYWFSCLFLIVWVIFVVFKLSEIWDEALGDKENGEVEVLE